ncbi:hypothetical protein Gohar_018419 [Gossypium harknessii]|uniref:Uncharacterized protein n=1 Tax=Gossypium harknessii TaxID=34285 RepID=A0A7J9GB65_9ROSI|nr:hypothetical protein [Gossypium harknessii]
MAAAIPFIFKESSPVILGFGLIIILCVKLHRHENVDDSKQASRRFKEKLDCHSRRIWARFIWSLMIPLNDPPAYLFCCFVQF